MRLPAFAPQLKREPLGGTTTDAHMSGPDLQQLREYYDRLSDEAIAELHASGPDAYSADAWAILDEEFRRRDIGATVPEPSVPPPRAKVSTVTAPTESVARGLPFVTVFATGNPALIAVAKLVLRAAGIPFLTKAEGVQDLIGLGRLFHGLNLATGPVQLQVLSEEADDAKDLLSEIRVHER